MLWSSDRLLSILTVRYSRTTAYKPISDSSVCDVVGMIRIPTPGEGVYSVIGGTIRLELEGGEFKHSMDKSLQYVSLLDYKGYRSEPRVMAGRGG